MLFFDIGCGQGVFGKQFKKIGCTAYGIDIDVQALECAKSSGGYKAVYQCDITDFSSEFIKDLEENKIERADVILFSDVLEHMTDPTVELTEYSRYLKDDGIILVSVPNISNIDIILNLINGRFNYTDMGILDNTHFKFFTKISFLQWIKQINNDKNMPCFDCEYIGATGYESEYVSSVGKEYPEIIRILGQQENAGALQIMFKLRKVSSSNETVCLDKLLTAEQPNVVDILGKVLNGSIHNLGQEKILNSQQERIEKIGELNRVLEGYMQSDINKTLEIERITKILAEKDSKITEISNERDKKSMEISKLNSMVSELRKQIFEMENSLSWKLTKIFRRNK